MHTIKALLFGDKMVGVIRNSFFFFFSGTYPYSVLLFVFKKDNIKLNEIQKRYV